jgi:hypothetical protein
MKINPIKEIDKESIWCLYIFSFKIILEKRGIKMKK